MTSTPRRVARPRWVILIGSAAAAVAIAICSGVAAGASPEPSADPGAMTNIEAWLDVAIPADAPPGESYAIGVTLWDTAQGRLAEFNGGYVRLHPAKGSAKPSLATTSSDWPGHLIADVEIPAGGAGALEIGLSDQVCTIRGSVQTCANTEFPFRLAGTGPPPDAPRTALIAATTTVPSGPLLAGEPIDLTVTIELQAGWDIASLGLPDQLVAYANKRSGPDLATATINDSGERTPTAITYRGQITIDESGEVTLFVALPGNGTEDQVLPGATTRLDIGGDVAGPSTAPSTAPPVPTRTPPVTESVPWPLIGLGVLIVAAGLLVRRVFADL